MLIPTYTRRSFIRWTFCYRIHFFLCFTVLIQNTRRDSISMINTLITIFVILVISFVLLLVSLFWYPCDHYHCLWPDDNGYHNIEWPQRVSLHCRRYKSLSRIIENLDILFWCTRKSPLKSPNGEVTFGNPKVTIWYPGLRFMVYGCK